MAGLALSGLASGVDTSAIVEQLMALERQQTTRLQNRQYAVTGQQTSLKDIATKLATLKSAASALSSDASWKQTQTAASSDANRVAVALTGGAGIGGHTVGVTRLASAAQRGFSFAGGTAGTFSVSYNTGTPQTISVDVTATSTIKDVADAINAKTSGPVVAAVVKNDLGQDRLVLSARKTGSDSDFTVTTGGVLAADSTYNTADLSTLNASWTLDGVAQAPSQTNVLENAIPGLRVTLKGVTSAAATVTVSEPTLDRDGVKTKVKAFVDAYNALVSATQVELDAKPVKDPTSEFQAGYGQLHGDAGMRAMLSSVRRQMTDIVAGAGINDLGDLGISVPKATGGTVSEDGKDGKLVIDDAKLSTALESDWTAVKSFFTTFSKQVGDYVDTQTGGSGVIDKRLQSSDRNLKLLQAQLDQTNERIDAKEKRLKAQFAAMESALQASQTQQAWLTGQLAALNNNG
jgi:flagellar hook-associated protein 2